MLQAEYQIIEESLFNENCRYTQLNRENFLKKKHTSLYSMDVY